MNTNPIKIRYVNYACYEIVLPNGKVIVIDPCIDFTGNKQLAVMNTDDTLPVLPIKQGTAPIITL